VLEDKVSGREGRESYAKGAKKKTKNENEKFSLCLLLSIQPLLLQFWIFSPFCVFRVTFAPFAAGNYVFSMFQNST
jgi:hypothetical protein